VIVRFVDIGGNADYQFNLLTFPFINGTVLSQNNVNNIYFQLRR